VGCEFSQFEVLFGVFNTPIVNLAGILTSLENTL